VSEYDPQVIKEFSRRMYAQTKSIVLYHLFLGILMGLISFSVISNLLTGDLDFLIVALGVMIGGVMGFGAGQSRSFELKLQAQNALCQAQIEENTRK